MRFTVIGHSCLHVETSAGVDHRRPVAVRVVLLAVVVALPADARARSGVAGARLRVPHAPPLRSLPLPVDAHASTARRARAGARVRDRRARRRGAQPRLRRRDGAAARRRCCSSRPRCASRRTSTAPTTPSSWSPTATRCSSTSTTRKIRGRALRQVRDEFGRPTFVFKSYSFAQGYPALLHRRRSRRPRAHHARQLPRRLDARGRRARARVRRAVRQHGRVPAPREPARQPVPRAAGRSGVHVRRRGIPARGRGRADGPGRQLEPRDRLRPRRRRLVRRPRAPPRRPGGRRCSPRSTPRPSPRPGVTLDFATFAAYFEGFMRGVPAGGARTRRAPPAGGVRGAVVAPAVLGARLPAHVGLPVVVAAARRRERRAGQRGGARRRHRQAPRARRARVDAHRGAPEGGRRGRRHHVLGAARAVGARLPAVAALGGHAARPRSAGAAATSGSSGSTPCAPAAPAPSSSASPASSPPTPTADNPEPASK